MTKQTENPLVQHLQRLAGEDGERPPDRGALAALRSSLARDRPLEALRVVLPAVAIGREVGDRERRAVEDSAVLLAQLYSLHPVSGERTLASALRRSMSERDSDSIEGRFRALLSAAREDLPAHLRHAVGLIASGGAGIDWTGLLRAIREWGRDDRRVQRAWARDFWAQEPADDDPEPPAPPAA